MVYAKYSMGIQLITMKYCAIFTLVIFLPLFSACSKTQEPNDTPAPSKKQPESEIALKRLDGMYGAENGSAAVILNGEIYFAITNEPGYKKLFGSEKPILPRRLKVEGRDVYQEFSDGTLHLSTSQVADAIRAKGAPILLSAGADRAWRRFSILEQNAQALARLSGTYYLKKSFFGMIGALVEVLPSGEFTVTGRDSQGAPSSIKGRFYLLNQTGVIYNTVSKAASDSDNGLSGGVLIELSDLGRENGFLLFALEHDTSLGANDTYRLTHRSYRGKTGDVLFLLNRITDAQFAELKKAYEMLGL